jgi:hypothetical protein
MPELSSLKGHRRIARVGFDFERGAIDPPSLSSVYYSLSFYPLRAFTCFGHWGNHSFTSSEAVDRDGNIREQSSEIRLIKKAVCE